MATTPRPRCHCCGTPYGQRDTTEHIVYIAEGTPIPPPPATNLIVARKRIQNYGTGRVRVVYDLWDGKTFLTPYRPFCTLRCALKYARKAAERSTGKCWENI